MMCERALSPRHAGRGAGEEADGAAEDRRLVHPARAVPPARALRRLADRQGSASTRRAPYIAAVKVQTAEVLHDVVRRALHIHGALGLLERDAAQRHVERCPGDGHRRRPDRGAQGHGRQAGAEAVPAVRGPAGRATSCHRGGRRRASASPTSSSTRSASMPELERLGAEGAESGRSRTVHGRGRVRAQKAWSTRSRWRAGWTSAACPARASRSDAASSPAARRTRSSRSAAATRGWRSAVRRARCPRAATRRCCASTACSHALHDTDVPHARGLGVCDDPSVLGACFYLMDCVDGWSCMERRGWPAPFDDDLDARQGLAFELVDGIAKLVERRLAGARARGLRQARGLPRAPGRPLARASRRRSSSATCPGIDVAAEWLRSYKPQALRAGHPPRRLPVRQRHVPPRRAGAPGRDRRLGDGDDRRSAARPRLGDDGLARIRTRTARRRRLRRLHGHADARGAARALRATRAVARSTRSTTT